MSEIKSDINKVIEELEQRGINFNTDEKDVVGLGDVIEETLSKFGVTEDRFKEFFGLKECSCSKRKKWLNNLLSWHRNSKD
jgi:hypothetical protein